MIGDCVCGECVCELCDGVAELGKETGAVWGGCENREGGREGGWEVERGKHRMTTRSGET